MVLAGAVSSVVDITKALGGFGGIAACIVAIRSSDKTEKSTQKVQKQFENNGGSSMRDRVDAIERRLDGGAARFDRLEECLDKHDNTLNSLSGDVREVIGYIRGQEGKK